MISRTILALVLALILGSASLVASAESQEVIVATPEATPAPRPVFAIQPVEAGATRYFLTEIEPGKTATLESRVITVDSIPVSLRAFATNAYSKPNGGFAAGVEADELTPPASWISFPAQTFDLGTNDQRLISFTVSVPEGTAPGQYVAALVVQTVEARPVEGTTAFNQILRNAVAVVINVPGKITSGFSLDAPEIVDKDGSIRLIVPISNTGNILVKPEGTLTIAKPDGTIVTTAPVKMDSIYMGNSTSIVFYLPQQFEAGDYVISGTLTDPATKATATIAPTTITFTPPADTGPVTFSLDPVTITAVGDPVQFANIEITVNNQGSSIPTGKIVLKVSKDGAPLEDYVLTQNQAMPTGTSTVSQRYIPATGFTSGTYTFEIVVSSVDSGGAETTILTIPVDTTIVVP